MEIVAELVHAGVGLAEVARLSDVQLREVHFRRRDEDGNLVRDGEDGRSDSSDPLRIGSPVSFETMWKAVMRRRNDYAGQVVDGEVYPGYTEEEIEQRWADYVANCPSLRRHLARREQGRLKPRDRRGSNTETVMKTEQAATKPKPSNGSEGISWRSTRPR